MPCLAIGISVNDAAQRTNDTTEVPLHTAMVPYRSDVITCRQDPHVEDLYAISREAGQMDEITLHITFKYTGSPYRAATD
jgi:hypothetical protein